jgi:hypothetical protein
MEAAASIVDGKNITNNGTVKVTSLQASSDLSGIIGGTLNAFADGDLIFTGDIGTANLTVNSGTFTIDTSADTASASSVTNESGATIVTDASKVNGITINNSGTLNINNLENATDADFSTVARGDDFNLDWSGTATFTGDLGSADLTVTSGTMTIDDSATITNANSIDVTGEIVANASKISTQTITGSGTVSVNNLEGQLDADFSNIAVDTLNVDWSGTGTYTGNLDNIDQLTVSSGTMTVADTIVDGISIDGGGDLTLTVNDGDLIALTNISNSGTLKLDMAENIDLSSKTDLDNVDIFSIANAKNLTMSDDQVGTKTVDGTGNLFIKVDDSSLDSDLSGVDSGLNITLDMAESIDLTAASNMSKVDTFDIANSKTVSLNDEQVRTTELDGGGEMLIVMNNSTDFDLSNLTKTSGSVKASAQGSVDLSDKTTDKVDSFEITGANTLTLTDTQTGTKTISGSGDFTVKVDDTTLDSDLSGVSTTGTVTLDMNDDNALDSKDISQVDVLDIAAGKSVTLLDTQAQNITKNGDGEMTVKVDSADDYGIDTITKNAGTITASIEADVDLSSKDTAKVDSFDITGTNLLTLTDDQVGSKTVTGASGGKLNVNVDNGTLATDFANVSNSGDITLNLAAAIDLSSNANLAKVDIYAISDSLTIKDSDISTKTATGNGHTLIIKTTSTDVDLSSIADGLDTTMQFTENVDGYVGNTSKVDEFIIDNGKTLKIDADKIGSKSVTNNGTLSLTNLEAQTDMDLSGIANTVHADWSGDATFTGDLGSADVTVSSGTMTADMAKIDAKTIGGAGTLKITGSGTVDLANISSNLEADIDGGASTMNNLKVNLDASASTQDLTINAEATTISAITGGSGNDTLYVNNDMTLSTFSSIETTTIASGKILTIDSSLVDGKSVSGDGTLYLVGSGDGDIDLSNMTSAVSADIDDASTTISGLKSDFNGSDSSSDLTVDIGGTSVATVYGGSGNDTMQISADNMNNTITIDAGGGNDTVALTSSAADFTSDDFANISEVESIDFASGNDTVSLDDNTLDNVQLNLGSGDDTVSVTSANLTNSDKIDAGADNDTLSITDAATLADSDFTNLFGFETLDLSDNANSVTLGSEAAEAGLTTVNGGTDSDTFTLDFSNLSTITTKDGDAGTDTAAITGTHDLAADEVFGTAGDFDNIEVLDLTAMTINGDDTLEFEITKEIIQDWSSQSDGDLTLKITSDQAENIKVTADDQNDIPDEGTKTFESVEDNHTYDFGDDVTLTVDIV